jgi:hypothetical protein
MDKVAQYLFTVETHQMGLQGSLDGAREAARILLHWRDIIWERAAQQGVAADGASPRR